jgi:hypothetical protein
MAHPLFLAALLAAGLALAAAAQFSCAETTCAEADGYFKLPNNPFEGIGASTTCTPCAQGDGCAVATGSCKECCYTRTCTNFDGRGTGYCPYGYGEGSVASIPLYTHTSGYNRFLRPASTL